MYDVVLKLKSLSQLTAMREVSVTLSARHVLEVAKENKFKVVAAVGIFGKGKSWVLSSIFKLDLPRGQLVATEGLSFYYLQKQGILVVDTAGMQSTAPRRTAEVEPVVDAHATETLILRMVIVMAHSLIFVVADFTSFEQLYVNRIHSSLTKNETRLIVVHNLSETVSINEARRRFKKQVESRYGGECHYEEQLVYATDEKPTLSPIKHVGLCKEGSAAGKFFNESNVKHIFQCVDFHKLTGTAQTFKALVCRSLEKLLPVFVNSDLGHIAVDFESVNDTEAKLVLRDAGSESRDSTFTRSLTMKTQGFVNPLGEIVAHDSSFNPVPNMYYQTVDDEYRFVIKVECIGVCRRSIRITGLANGVRIFMEKKQPVNEAMTPHHDWPCRQRFGTWRQDFLVPPERGIFFYNNRNQSFKLGVLTVWLVKHVEVESGGFDDNGDPIVLQNRQDGGGSPLSSTTILTAGSSWIRT
mmetsp:Transcript_7814/g.17466  ORF Transcript_7814/g.17466 Transcript_7814/m.17466 type:complete len:469 (+) Transcript_7814:979-2385(+)